MCIRDELPKISIITVSYNSEKTIEQTIVSVIEQTYENIEYIIIDGDSHDRTVDFIMRYEMQLAYWVSEPDSGIYDAMNKGIDRATGDYIYFIGSDDCLVDAEIIYRVAQTLMGNYDVFSGKVWNVDENLQLQMEYTNKFDINDIYIGYCIPHQGLFVKTKILKEYHFDCNYKIAADRDLFYKLFFNKTITCKFSDEKIAFYSNSGISSLEVLKRMREDIEIMYKYKIPKRFIHAYQTRTSNSLKKYIKYKLKKMLMNLNCIRYILKKKGWQDHRCDWKHCRWCSKKLR